LSIAEITRRLDDRFNVLSDPISRRPERRRALKSTIRWSYDLLFPDDQRGLWALATFAGGAPLAAVESVLERLAVPAAAAIDVVGRLASRSLVIVDDDEAAMSVRYRLLDSIPRFALDAMTDAGLSERAFAAHAAWFAAAAASSRKVCAAAAKPSISPSRGPSAANIDAALAWSDARPAARARHRQRVRLGWVVLGDSRGAQRILAALDARGDAAPAATAPAPCCSRRGSKRRRSPRTRPRPHRIGRPPAEAIGDVDLQARSAY
jgi:predicted ATPase